MTLNKLAEEIHNNSVKHGWYEEDRTLGDIISLCHCELSEAIEAYRNNEPLEWDNKGKPDGIAVEMLDCVIRIFDYLAFLSVDIDDIIKRKMEYNKVRPYKHGGKVM